MHLLSQSFLIYLKYQAMVDSYYYNVVMKPEQIAIADAPTQVIAISDDEKQNSESPEITENAQTTNQ